MADPTPTPPALDLASPLRVHVVGAGGAGMSAIASVLAAMGHRVTGSDLKASPIARRLTQQGVPVAVGHDADHVGDAEAVTYSPAVREDNPELREARRRGIPVYRRATVLAAIAAVRPTIAVAGTHGKTTTSSMLALVLVEAGLRPSFLIGADVDQIGANAVWDSGPWLVLEADESYGTFAEIRPELAVVTSVEPDHLDHYGTVENLHAAFAGLLDRAGRGAVVNQDDPVAAALGHRVGAAGVGLAPDASYRMSGLVTARSSVGFDLAAPDGQAARFELPVPGAHNAQNAALAVAAAHRLGVPLTTAVTALARFAGVPRRFEFRGEAAGVTFVDDYAHLPTEVRAVLAAARAGGWARVVAVFQPHRYTRTAALHAQFADAFADADAVVVTDVYGAGEPPVPGVSGRLVVDAVVAHDPSAAVAYAATHDEVVAELGRLLRPGDLCVTIGAGDLTNLPDELIASPTW
jgi:UDP-N-acetylmuramate--alanine ligase